MRSELQLKPGGSCHSWRYSRTGAPPTSLSATSPLPTTAGLRLSRSTRTTNSSLRKSRGGPSCTRTPYHRCPKANYVLKWTAGTRFLQTVANSASGHLARSLARQNEPLKHRKPSPGARPGWVAPVCLGRPLAAGRSGAMDLRRGAGLAARRVSGCAFCRLRLSLRRIVAFWPRLLWGPAPLLACACRMLGAVRSRLRFNVLVTGALTRRSTGPRGQTAAKPTQIGPRPVNLVVRAHFHALPELPQVRECRHVGPGQELFGPSSLGQM